MSSKKRVPAKISEKNKENSQIKKRIKNRSIHENLILDHVFQRKRNSKVVQRKTSLESRRKKAAIERSVYYDYWDSKIQLSLIHI